MRALPDAASRRRYNFAIISRAFAALAGGYAVAASFSTCAAQALARGGMAAADAVVVANMLAFAAHAAAALWAFGCATALRAWLGVMGWALLPVIALWGLQRGWP
ncbi:iron transporter [Pseudomonas aeruginosa]|uniref:iron transporter n=1 Tax=Pseudomonas aeruginosa TaxID=287 RepID=UPI000BAA7BAC|nr:iron transporter [Pseudomonas aeruginosa]PAT49830.1 hypothetical protein CJU40_00925 [Pseudomonas aeruginosa]PCA38853.1 hypothetical protein CJU41_00925 [Pseudomonas aeruginosa]PCA40927.1 hypothetical protein CJU39_22790 [Pseudomonas aeruginosa]